MANLIGFNIELNLKGQWHEIVAKMAHGAVV
jgi:hypothetical protein